MYRFQAGTGIPVSDRVRCNMVSSVELFGTLSWAWNVCSQKFCSHVFFLNNFLITKMVSKLGSLKDSATNIADLPYLKSPKHK